MFSSILVPTDGSAASNVALPLARTVAKATGASITLMRVLKLENHAPSRKGFVEAQDSLRHIATELRESVTSVDSVVEGAKHVADAILGQSRTQNADLIIMRTHGRAGLQRAVIGSVTQQVLGRSTVPLMLLRPGGRRISQIRRLFVPIDGSPGGTLALNAAVQLARNTGANIRIQQVVVPVPQGYSGEEPYGGLAFYDPTWAEDATASAKEYVDSLVTRLHAANITATGEARQDPDVALAIVAAADADSADMIVMTTHARTGPARALLGSTADIVVRTAHCPVLLIHRTPVSESAQLEFETEPATTSA